MKFKLGKFGRLVCVGTQRSWIDLLYRCMLVAILTLPIIPNSVAMAPSATQGLWQGSYTCGSNDTGIDLRLKTSENGEVDAVIEFYSMPSSTTKLTPSMYRATGHLSADGALVLKPTEWIKKAGPYFMGTLDGAISDSPAQFKGVVTECSGEKSFSIFKVSDDRDANAERVDHIGGEKPSATSNADAPHASGGFLGRLLSRIAEKKKTAASNSESSGSADSTVNVPAVNYADWSVANMKLGTSQTAAEDIFKQHQPAAQFKKLEQSFKTKSGAFVTSSVVMGEELKTDFSPSGRRDDAGASVLRETTLVGFTWPSPGQVFAVRQFLEYGPKAGPGFEVYPSVDDVRKSIFARFGRPAYVNEEPFNRDYATQPEATGRGSSQKRLMLEDGSSRSEITWVWTAKSSYTTPEQFVMCAGNKPTSSGWAWAKADLGNSRVNNPKCGVSLSVRVERADSKHVGTILIEMFDHTAYKTFADQFDDYLASGDSEGLKELAALPSIRSTALAGLFTRFPYDGTEKTYYPKIAINVTNWRLKACWTAKATLWWSATKSENIPEFSMCWMKANYQWKLDSISITKSLESQTASQTSGNVRTSGPKPPLRALPDKIPDSVDIAEYQNFAHGIVEITGWAEGAPTNIWIAGFLPGKSSDKPADKR